MLPPNQGSNLFQRFDEMVRVTGSSPPESGVQAVRRFFQGLSEKQIAELVHHRADVIGRLDGEPARRRYEANRLRLEKARDALREKVAQGIATAREHTRLLTVEDLLKPRIIVARDTDGKRVELASYRQFLAVDPTGGGRVVEVLGDLDQAEHVAVMVAGVRSEMESGPYLTDRAEKIHNEAGPHKTATIMWLDYDAPKTERDAMSKRYAEAAAAGFHRFVAGLRTEVPPGTSVTAIGHSYGSVVVGHACLHGMRINRVVFTGSPGIRPEARSAADLGLSKGQLYVLRTPGDKVSYSQWHGPDPASFEDAFRLRTDGRLRIRGHDRYPSPNTESVVNIGRVVSDRLDELTFADTTPAQETLLGWGAALRGIATPIARAHDRVIALTQPRPPHWIRSGHANRQSTELTRWEDRS